MSYTVHMDIKCTVTRESPDTYGVELEHPSGLYTYHVQVTEEDMLALIPEQYRGDISAVVRASFAFLLDREPPTSILTRFKLSLITRYFPEYPKEIHTYIEATL